MRTSDIFQSQRLLVPELVESINLSKPWASSLHSSSHDGLLPTFDENSSLIVSFEVLKRCRVCGMIRRRVTVPARFLRDEDIASPCELRLGSQFTVQTLNSNQKAKSPSLKRGVLSLQMAGSRATI